MTDVPHDPALSQKTRT